MCNLLPQREVSSDINSARLPGNHTFAQTPKVDPPSRAQAASGAQGADAQGFRACAEMGALETPLAASSYGVWELSERRIALVCSHEWHVAARFGPQAGGVVPNYLRKMEETPPAIHRSSLCEALRFLHIPCQIVAPSSMNTDAFVGFLRTGYESPFSAIETCDGEKGSLSRAEVTSSRGSRAARGNPAQR